MTLNEPRHIGIGIVTDESDRLDAAEQQQLDALEILDNAINYIQHSQDWDAENFMDTIGAIGVMSVAESKVRRS